jgi:hypothetical protein
MPFVLPFINLKYCNGLSNEEKIKQIIVAIITPVIPSPIVFARNMESGIFKIAVKIE